MKKILLLVLSCFTIFLVTGCGNEEEFKDVTISIKDGTLTESGATFILKNHTDKTYTFGEDYKLEQKDASSWKSLPCDDCWVNLSARLLEANQETELNYNWESTFGKLEKGTYRLVKTVHTTDEENDISIEFNIN